MEIEKKVSEIQEVKLPFWYHLARGSVGKVVLGLLAGLGWLMVQVLLMVFLHPVSVIGVVLSPFWFVVIYLFLETQSIHLIEVQFKGDLLDPDLNKISSSTDINGWSISPEIWRECEKIGSPNIIGSRGYVCERFDQKNKKIYFPDHPFLSNINAMVYIEKFLELKNKLPNVMRENSKLKLEMGEIIEERVVSILEEIGVFKLFIQNPGDWESHGSYRRVYRGVKKDLSSDGSGSSDKGEVGS